VYAQSQFYTSKKRTLSERYQVKSIFHDLIFKL
jgi:hypothetical protein